MIFEHTEKAIARLRHIDGHLESETGAPERISKRERIIQDKTLEGTDDSLSHASSIIGLLESHCRAKAMSTWFNTGDLAATKNWLYTESKLFYIRFHRPYYDGPLWGMVARVMMGLNFLISDHPALIKWYCEIDKGFDRFKGFIPDKTTSDDFYTQQFFHAIRGEWDILGDRSERVIANPPKSGFAKMYMPDHAFYLALARGDAAAMERQIAALVTPKQIYGQRGYEGGYTENLISTRAILCSKLAWRHGYEIVVDNPHIPKEWLPVTPLGHYEDPFDFMKQYDVN